MTPLNLNLTQNSNPGITFPSNSGSGLSRLAEIIAKFNTLEQNYGAKIGNSGQDLTSIENVWNGKAKSADYGSIIGTGVGAYFGHPEIGNIVGKNLFKAVRSLF